MLSNTGYLILSVTYYLTALCSRSQNIEPKIIFRSKRWNSGKKSDV